MGAPCLFFYLNTLPNLPFGPKQPAFRPYTIIKLVPSDASPRTSALNTSKTQLHITVTTFSIFSLDG